MYSPRDVQSLTWHNTACAKFAQLAKARRSESGAGVELLLEREVHEVQCKSDKKYNEVQKSDVNVERALEEARRKENMDLKEGEGWKESEWKFKRRPKNIYDWTIAHSLHNMCGWLRWKWKLRTKV